MIGAREMIVDLFAGGGGASTGIREALGRDSDIAINHSAAAVAMHTANHPTTRHYQEDIWEVDPRKAVGRRKVGLLWASPDCRHFSRAKGGVPVSKGVRSLAWVVVRWAAAVKPRVIVVENVDEFRTWGPLGTDGRPCPERVGQTFAEWVDQLRLLGYEVQWKSLVAADYGAPTTRKRFFLVARCDGRPIVWPSPTHGKGRIPWRTAAEIIDWTIPCPSIFERRKPLAEATLRRIATGVWRYVINAAKPFIVPVTHAGGDRVHGLNEPVRTVTCAHRGELALVAPSLIQTGYGERDGQAPRVLDLHQPLGTVVAGGQKQGLVAALLTKHYGGVVGHEVERPIGTVTATDHHSLTAAVLIKQNFGSAPFQSAEHPLHTVTTQHNRFAEVRAFLVKYYGTASGADVREPLDTVTTRDRFGLVTVDGQDYAIADIGMRMLQPRELFAAQGFPVDYDILDGTLTKTQQVACGGNSVPPHLARALVAAQFGSSAEPAVAA